MKAKRAAGDIRHRTIALVLASALLSLTVAAPCQQKEKESRDSVSNDLSLARAAKAVGDGLLSPFHWKNDDVLVLALVAGAGVFVSLLDEDIRNWAQERKTPSSEHVFRAVTRFGDGGSLCAFMAGLYAVGGVTGQRGVRKTALMCFESFLVSSAFSTILKYSIGRARPEANEGRYSFHPFSRRSSFTSLPSGHSSAIWSVATVIADRTDCFLVDVICYGTAALTSLSRIHEDKHWGSDVLIGSALGYFTAKKICSLNRNPKGPRLSSSFDLLGGQQSITLSLRF